MEDGALALSLSTPGRGPEGASHHRAWQAQEEPGHRERSQTLQPGS